MKIQPVLSWNMPALERVCGFLVVTQACDLGRLIANLVTCSLTASYQVAQDFHPGATAGHLDHVIALALPDSAPKATLYIFTLH